MKLLLFKYYQIPPEKAWRINTIIKFVLCFFGWPLLLLIASIMAWIFEFKL